MLCFWSQEGELGLEIFCHEYVWNKADGNMIKELKPVTLFYPSEKLPSFYIDYNNNERRQCYDLRILMKTKIATIDILGRMLVMKKYTMKKGWKNQFWKVQYKENTRWLYLIDQ